MTGDALLEIRGLKVVRGGRMVASVPSLTLRTGLVFAIMGPNGAGKSSVVLSLPLLIPATWEKYEFLGNAVDPGNALWIRRQMAVVFQDALLFDGTVLYNVCLGMTMRGIARDEAADQAKHWLQRLGVAHLSGRHARSLSGGEAQRVSIARALCLKPQALLMDEPFSGLDVMSRISLLEDIKPVLAESGTAALLVTHDFSEAALLADNMMVMDKGLELQSGTPAEILHSPQGPAVSTLVGFARKMGSVYAGERFS